MHEHRNPSDTRPGRTSDGDEIDIIPLEAASAPPRQRGLRPIAKSPHKPGKKCEECGYDMTGLPSSRCPECGTVARPMTREKFLRSESKQTARDAYLKPILMFLIAGGLLTAALFFLHGPSDAGRYLLSFAIEVPVGVGVFFLCCLIWLGFDAPMHLTALRLAGIYAVIDLVSVGAAFIPFFGWLITLFVYVGMLSEILEMELSDAVLVGFLTFVAKVAIGLAILAMIGT